MNKKTNLTLPTIDELFTTQEQRDEIKHEKVYEIPLELIDAFPNHPYRVMNDESMTELAISIAEHGVMTPIGLWAKYDSRYEIVSGHRRNLGYEIFFFGQSSQTDHPII